MTAGQNKTIMVQGADFKKVTSRIQITLPPIYCSGRINEGIADYFNKLLLRYVPEMKGVLVAYNNVKPESPVGQIINEYPHITFYVHVDLLLFEPRLKSILVGIVNKVSPDHIGLLVHGIFNASIPSQELIPLYSWNGDASTWDKNDSSDLSISPGTVVKFSVMQRSMHNEMLTLSGSLLDPAQTGVVKNVYNSFLNESM